jgi:hypothetical protein
MVGAPGRAAPDAFGALSPSRVDMPRAGRSGGQTELLRADDRLQP